MGGGTALWDTEGRAAAAKVCPETLEPLTPSSLNPQPLTVPRGTSTAVPCAQDHRMFIICLWLLHSSCSSKLWGSRTCLCYRKVKFRTARLQALQLEQAPGSAAVSSTAGAGPSGRAALHEGWPLGHEAGIKVPMSILYQVSRGKGRGQLLRTPHL